MRTEREATNEILLAIGNHIGMNTHHTGLLGSDIRRILVNASEKIVMENFVDNIADNHGIELDDEDIAEIAAYFIMGDKEPFDSIVDDVIEKIFEVDRESKVS